MRESFPKLQRLPSSTAHPGEAGRGKTLNNLLSRHRRRSRRSASLRKRKNIGTGVLRQQNPPRSRVEIPEARKAGIRPNHGSKKAPTILPSLPDRGKDGSATEANPPKARPCGKNASLNSPPSTRRTTISHGSCMWMVRQTQKKAGAAYCWKDLKTLP
ncbi:hypothetical protein PIB30_068262 [Stylosanthes scabra]|uniref:Uncharacterized protein n=1 Tax=Stylosanthes scabra TaxID=79078 RepID=A0ABU6WMR6_9FABA|nr:hypothetical protein [Stylosanthes scabra]